MKYNVVFVDDESMVVKALRRLLQRQSFNFFGFDSPGLALEQMDEINPQVVLSDQRMPEMEGSCFLEKVGEKWPETIRMILTGYAIPKSLHGAISSGAVLKVLTKPWDDDQLLQHIRMACHCYQAAQFAKIYQCDICGEKGRSNLVQPHSSFYMCRRCKDLNDLLPNVVSKSLRRFISGNIP